MDGISDVKRAYGPAIGGGGGLSMILSPDDLATSRERPVDI